MKFFKVSLDKDGRMFTPLRVGKNKGRWFIRVDLWWVGFRIEFNEEVEIKPLDKYLFSKTQPLASDTQHYERRGNGNWWVLVDSQKQDLVSQIVDRDTPPDNRNDIVDYDITGQPITRGMVAAWEKPVAS